MEGNRFYLFVTIIVASQFLNTYIISSRLPDQDSETIQVPVQPLSSEQDPTNPYPLTAAIRLPTEEALRKLIRSALQKELAAISDDSVIFNSKSAQGRTGQASQTISANQETIDPQVRDEVLSQTSSVIDQAIENGKWTDQDNQRLAEKIHMIDAQQRLQLINKLGEAMERGEIQLESGTVPIL